METTQIISASNNLEDTMEELLNIRIPLPVTVNRMEDSEIRAFDYDAAKLVNFIQWKIRNGAGTVFELPIGETGKALDLGRRKQDNAVAKLIAAGVIERVRGGQKNVRTFLFHPDAYMRATARSDDNSAGKIEFINKYDNVEMQRFERRRQVSRVEKLRGECLKQIEGLKASLNNLSHAINQLEASGDETDAFPG